jgi:hypothetical protein
LPFLYYDAENNKGLYAAIFEEEYAELVSDKLAETDISACILKCHGQ